MVLRLTPPYAYSSKDCPVVARVAVIVKMSSQSKTTATQMPTILIQSYESSSPSLLLVIFASILRPCRGAASADFFDLDLVIEAVGRVNGDFIAAARADERRPEGGIYAYDVFVGICLGGAHDGIGERLFEVEIVHRYGVPEVHLRVIGALFHDLRVFDLVFQLADLALVERFLVFRRVVLGVLGEVAEARARL